MQQFSLWFFLGIVFTGCSGSFAVPDVGEPFTKTMICEEKYPTSFSIAMLGYLDDTARMGRIVLEGFVAKRFTADHYRGDRTFSYEPYKAKEGWLYIWYSYGGIGWD